jgi:hypothetical protein
MQPLHTFSDILEAWQRVGGTERSQLRSALLEAGWLSATRHAVAERQVEEIEDGVLGKAGVPRS